MLPVPLLRASSPSCGHLDVRRLIARVAALALMAIGSVAPAHAHAQTTAYFDITAYVPQPLSVTASQHLDFGSIAPGVEATIQTTDVSRPPAQIAVSGAACAGVLVSFTLPSDLDGPSSAKLPIDTWTGDWVGGTSTTWQPFTPSGATTSVILDRDANDCGGVSGVRTDDETGQATLRVGATVRPAAGQTSGVYSNTLTIEVTYVDL